MFFGTDDDNFWESGDGGDDSGSKLNSSVDFINFEDVVASLVSSLDKRLHFVIDLFGSKMNLSD